MVCLFQLSFAILLAGECYGVTESTKSYNVTYAPETQGTSKSEVNGSTSAIKLLEGLWKEDVAKRTNMEEFLSAAGVNPILKKAVTEKNWTSTLNITLNGNKVITNGNITD